MAALSINKKCLFPFVSRSAKLVSKVLAFKIFFTCIIIIVDFFRSLRCFFLIIIKKILRSIMYIQRKNYYYLTIEYLLKRADVLFWIMQLVGMPPWRNRLARSAVNRKVGGSSPPGGVFFFLNFSLISFL